MNMKSKMLGLATAFALRFAPKPADPIRSAGDADAFPVLDGLLPADATGFAPEPDQSDAPALEAMQSEVKRRIHAADTAPDRRSGRNVVRALARQGRSTGMPHQGNREAARRRGGDEWEAYRAADRMCRGLEG